MSKPAHTPGPWTADIDSGFIQSDSQIICQFWNKLEDDFPNKEANMLLAQAGPDLLAAVRVAQKFFINPGSFNPLDVEHIYEAAIAKATKASAGSTGGESVRKGGRGESPEQERSG
jgi:hypothetical protein